LDQTNTEKCTFRQGALPECAPLALAYVPMQQAGAPTYDTGEGLKRGTLFPGLDLPFMNMVNTTEVAGTPLGEVMALCFAAHEMLLYLDTHPNDTEAFKTYQGLLALGEEAKRRYTEKFGPLCTGDLAEQKSFKWLCGPWPWEYEKRGED